jgi:hypothetical protein
LQRTEFNKRSRTTDEAGTKMKHKHKWGKTRPAGIGSTPSGGSSTLVWMKCVTCGVIYLPWKGDDFAGFAARYQCRPCFNRSWDNFLRLREEYQRLVALGVHPKVADRMMQRRISSSHGEAGESDYRP